MLKCGRDGERKTHTEMYVRREKDVAKNEYKYVNTMRITKRIKQKKLIS